MSSQQRRETSVNWLREELREWAQWDNAQRKESENSGGGFSSETVIYLAMNGAVSMPFGPSIPHGAIPPKNMERIVHAMRRLSGDPRLGWYVAATRHYYKNGEDIAKVMAEFGCTSKSAAYALRERGEDAIRAFLRA